MDVEQEIRELKRRVGDLEGAVNVLAGQVGKVHPELLNLTTASANRFDQVDAVLSKMTTRLDMLNTQLWGLRDDLPQLIRTTPVGTVRDSGSR